MSIYVAGALALFIFGIVAYGLYKNMRSYDQFDMK